jgi:hypothetical protein
VSGRLRDHATVSAALTALDDAELAALIGAPDDDVGIGGARGGAVVDGTPVFVKRLPLTDRERRPEVVGSTANLFGLPAHCHFGVGSPGFGAWRELVAVARASEWVISGKSESFPLLHHWRVLPGAVPPADEIADVEAAVALWGGHPAVRDRLCALADASSSLVLLMERVPTTANAWLADQATHGEEALRRAMAMVESELRTGTAFMAGRGMIHFDAHFDNVLTDGHRLYFADLGLAARTDFALCPDEIELVERARTHDVAHTLTRLVNWAVSTFAGPSCAEDPVVRNAFVQACARGAAATALPEPAADVVGKYAPLASIVNAFYAELFTMRRDAPYPAAEIGAELARLLIRDRRPRADPG